MAHPQFTPVPSAPVTYGERHLSPIYSPAPLTRLWVHGSGRFVPVPWERIAGVAVVVLALLGCGVVQS